MDNGLFWKLFNRKRSSNTISSIGEFQFGGKTVRDPDQICQEWGNYFADLYSDTDNLAYDDDCHSRVNSTVDTWLTSDFNTRDQPSFTLY